MKKLTAILNEAAKAYYSGGESALTDKEYDAMLEELRKMEAETGVILPDSPTQRVGYKVVSELQKVSHKYPALSLDKTKRIDKLTEWMGDRDCVLSWKCDGLTAIATYQDGKLVCLATRGDGFTGENVTHNAPYIHGLPATIPVTGEVVVRGEVMIRYDDFDTINAEIANPEERYMNPRNLASSSLRLTDSFKAKNRKLQFRAFTLVSIPDRAVHTVMDSFDLMENLGFATVEHLLVDDIPAAVHQFADAIADHPFPTDGLVLTYDELAYGRSLGTTGRFPKNAIAFKWKDDTVGTTLRKIEWSASRTGLINPVAVFDPVELEGSIVERASLHNIRYMEKLCLGYGDTITIYKANKIIPQVDENLSQNGHLISVPDVCPVCGQPTERRLGASEFLYCGNPDCPAKHTGRFVRLVERDGLNVTGLSKATVERLVERGFLKTFRSLYYLSDYKNEIMELDGFGEKSFAKLIGAVEKAETPLSDRHFTRLGFPERGMMLERFWRST